MAEIIFDKMGSIEVKGSFETIHNYLHTDKMILAEKGRFVPRKGKSF